MSRGAAGVSSGDGRREGADAAQRRAEAVPDVAEVLKRRKKAPSALAGEVLRSMAARQTKGAGREAARADQGTGAQGASGAASSSRDADGRGAGGAPAGGAGTVEVVDIGGDVSRSGEIPAAPGAVGGWALQCFRSQACSQAPDFADAQHLRLLEPLPVDLCERIYGVSRRVLVETLWAQQRTVGVKNLGNTCFVSAVMQVFARLDPLARMLAGHRHRMRREDCVVCFLKEDLRLLRLGAQAVADGRPLARSLVALAARRGLLRRQGAQENAFEGDAATGAGPQCDAWEFCEAVWEKVLRWESDQTLNLLRGASEEDRARVAARSVLGEYVWGGLVRSRVRCSRCEGASDALAQVVFLDLNLPSEEVRVYRSLRALYEYHVSETRGRDTRCPLGCGGLAYTQKFLEREPSVLFLRLLRFNTVLHQATGVYHEVRLDRLVDIPEKIDFLRSGEYHFAGAVLHHGAQSVRGGHYTALCWEGEAGGAGRYRLYNDGTVGALQPWAQACRVAGLHRDAYLLAYTRVKFWGDAVGDGSEATPYVRDPESVRVAKASFRGDRRV